MDMRAASPNLKTARNSRANQPVAIPLSYSLKAGSAFSNTYYAAIAVFAGRWTEQLHPWLDEEIGRVQTYRSSHTLAVRTFDELALELLVLGVAWREHAAQAQQTPAWVMRLMQALVARQQQHPRFETLYKTLRGWLNGLFYPAVQTATRCRPSWVGFKKLLAWLFVQGADSQAARLDEWSVYLEQLDPSALEHVLRTALELADKFAGLSETCLGSYTAQVESYRTRSLPAARWRYDRLLATEILNRAYQAEYQATHLRLVILPPCLCYRPEKVCRAVPTPLGAQCSGCTPACRVNQITRAAAQKGVRVVMIPDDQLSQLCLSSGLAGKGLGVVGVACVQRNWCAGWEAQRLGLHAQGVLLDHAGCRKHWHPRGLMTDVNVQQVTGLL